MLHVTGLGAGARLSRLFARRERPGPIDRAVVADPERLAVDAQLPEGDLRFFALRVEGGGEARGGLVVAFGPGVCEGAAARFELLHGALDLFVGAGEGVAHLGEELALDASVRSLAA